MDVSYFVMWIPQRRKGNPQIIQDQLDIKPLCDIDTLPCLYVRGSISVSHDILLEYSIGEESLDKKLEFKYIESDNRGFVIYKLVLDDQQDDFLCKLLRKEMPNAIYHYFKSFYHEHVFHDEAEDSLLSPYFSSSPIKWTEKKVQNKVVESLIADYTTKYEGAYEIYSDRYALISANLYKGEGVNPEIEKLKKLLVESREKLNERSYSDFLLASFPSIKETKKRELENALRTFETLIIRQESLLNQTYTEKSFGYTYGGYLAGKYGLIVGVFGLVVGIGTSVYSLRDSRCQSRKSTMELKEHKEDVLKCIQSETNILEEEEQIIIEQSQQINNRIDSLTDEIHQLQRKLKK